VPPMRSPPSSADCNGIGDRNSELRPHDRVRDVLKPELNLVGVCFLVETVPEDQTASWLVSLVRVGAVLLLCGYSVRRLAFPKHYS
jgi:hypothetical protein